MSKLVIVAIPRKDDYVWRISSEKIPHVTLLVLGELTDQPVEQIADFLEHAASTALCKFELSVDRRGVLGKDDADVLFLKEYGDRLKTFRSYLLQNDAIAIAYRSVPQFPEWTPHLTLGYPKSPARKDERDYPGINWIEFDRVALWTDDFSGPEFELKSQEYMDVAMSDLTHYGVKGMKWGVRRAATRPHSSDAIVVREARTKRKKQGTSSLSNDELQAIANRLNLEQRVSDLSKRDAKIRKGQQAVSTALAIGTTINAVVAFANSPAGKAVAAGLRTAATK